MSAMRDERTSGCGVAGRAIALTAIAGGCLLLSFWALYFLRLFIPGGKEDPIVRGFESAFPCADALLGLVLIGAGVGLLRGSNRGVFLLTVGASMTLYLGILDVSFYAARGTYCSPTPSSLVTGFINLICIGGGLLGLWSAHRMGRYPRPNCNGNNIRGGTSS